MRPDAHITGITLYREKDLSQVLQMHTIYTNVAQGVIAKKADITKVFGKADTDEICKEILKFLFTFFFSLLFLFFFLFLVCVCDAIIAVADICLYTHYSCY